jgi:hypothetical protein
VDLVVHIQTKILCLTTAQTTLALLPLSLSIILAPPEGSMTMATGKTTQSWSPLLDPAVRVKRLHPGRMLAGRRFKLCMYSACSVCLLIAALSSIFSVLLFVIVEFDVLQSH